MQKTKQKKIKRIRLGYIILYSRPACLTDNDELL